MLSDIQQILGYCCQGLLKKYRAQCCVWWVGRKVAEGGEFIYSKETRKLLLDNPSFQHFLWPFLPSVVLTIGFYGICWLEQNRYMLNCWGRSISCSLPLEVDIEITFIILCSTFEASRNRNFPVRPQDRKSLLIIRNHQNNSQWSQ